MRLYVMWREDDGESVGMVSVVDSSDPLTCIPDDELERSEVSQSLAPRFEWGPHSSQSERQALAHSILMDFFENYDVDEDEGFNPDELFRAFASELVSRGDPAGFVITSIEINAWLIAKRDAAKLARSGA
jgi:hypothetical protein